MTQFRTRIILIGRRPVTSASCGGLAEIHEIVAESRVQAYINLYQHYSQQGCNVAAYKHHNPHSTPLDFSPAELDAIHALGITTEPDSSALTIADNQKFGVQIEQLVSEHDQTGRWLALG